MQPALTPLASYGSGLSPQGLLPSAYPNPKAGQNKGPFGGNGRKPEPAQRGINLRGEGWMTASGTERRVRQRRIQAFQALKALTQSSPFF